MSDADLDTQQLCDRLNALTLEARFDDLTCHEAIEAWWEGWTIIGPVAGDARTSYILNQDDVWVWLTVACGNGISSRVIHWFSKDKHARAMLLFGALRESLVSDYTGIYLAVKAWKESPSQTSTMMQTMSREGIRNAGPAWDLLNKLDARDPGVDHTVLDFMSALRGEPTGPLMPYPLPY